MESENLITKIDMLLDFGAAVSIGFTDDVNMEHSRFRIITANGLIVDVDGMLEISVNDFELLVQMVKRAKEWLLSLPELSCWSLQVIVYLRAGGTLRFGLSEGKPYKLVQDPEFEKVRDVKLLGSTEVLQSAIKELASAKDCGEMVKCLPASQIWIMILRMRKYLWMIICY